MTLVLLAIGAYFLGSIPIGYLVGKAQGIDIRAVGSGNIGATNVLRTLGKKWGYTVFVLDVLKGFIPAFAAKMLGYENDWSFVIGLCAVFGHSLSPFLGFKGGKGIATGLGVLLGSVTLVGMSSFAVFFIFMALTMIVSLSSIMAAFTLPIWGLVFGETVPVVVVLFVMGIYIISRHKANLARIRAGTEPKIGQKSVDEPPPSMTARLVCFGLAIGLGAGAVTQGLRMTEGKKMTAQEKTTERA